MVDPIRREPSVVGGTRTQGAARTGAGAHTESSRRTGWTISTAPAALDELIDVDAPAVLEGLLLRGPDGIVRPISVSDVRTDVFGGDGPPPDVVPGAAKGDLYVNRLTGDLYRLD